MKPRLMLFGSPSPRKLSDASSKMAIPTSNEPLIITGGIAFGRISLKMILASEVAKALAAVTNSRSLSERY